MSSKTRQGSKQQRPSKAERRAAERRRAQRRRVASGLSAVAVAAVIVALVATSRGDGVVVPSPPGAVRVSGPPRAQPLAVGQPVPEFSAPALEGGRFVWSEVAIGPTVLAVWAPWCPHCQTEMPVLDRVSAAFPGVRLVSVVTGVGDAPGPEPDAYMEEKGLSFPTAVDDGEGTIARALGIQGFPTVFYVGSGGVVRQVTEGEVDEPALRSLFDRLG